MTLYTYQAKNKSGELYEKTVESADKFALYKVIRDEGGTVVTIKEKRTGSFNISFGNLLSTVSTQEKINFAKNLSAMLDAGLSVNRSLVVMGKQAKRQSFKNLLSEIESDVSHGTTLSESLSKKSNIFSPLFISMVRAGEESGSVSGSLKIVGEQMEKSYLLVKKVRGAMIYPAVIIGVMIVLAVLLLVFMVPTLTATFSGIGIELPLSTRAVIFVSDFLIGNTVLVLGIFLLLVLCAVSFFRSVSGRRIVDTVSLRIPVIGGIVREVQVARTARTLSSLLSAGVDVVVALKVTSEVLQNHLYKEVLEEASVGIQKGETLSSIFSRHENIYPVFVGEMSAVGEETGKVAGMLTGVATYYEDQVDQKTKDLSTIIEPILMIVIGAGVGLFAISMLAPTYSLVDYI